MSTAIYDGLRFTAMSSEIKAAIARGTRFGLASIAILALQPWVFAISWEEDRSPMARSWGAWDRRRLRRRLQWHVQTDVV
ncbi:MFS transporter [Mesorhizobium sp.]|uniref:MFS transporter n=1 Tax=Mesorhizobium sp. TaxID=1871066 RepID=UPI00257AB37F|nr:MFS transporter [Mesorhizobium sp.]